MVDDGLVGKVGESNDGDLFQIKSGSNSQRFWELLTVPDLIRFNSVLKDTYDERRGCRFEGCDVNDTKLVGVLNAYVANIRANVLNGSHQIASVVETGGFRIYETRYVSPVQDCSGL